MAIPLLSQVTFDVVVYDNKGNTYTAIQTVPLRAMDHADDIGMAVRIATGDFAIQLDKDVKSGVSPITIFSSPLIEATPK